jgi:hypothetical protein
MSERRHRHLVETGLTLLTDAHMPLSYWPYAFQTAAYLINRMPTSTLNNQSPFEKLFKQIPNYLKLKQFGCLCYPLTKPYNKHKLEPKAQPCTFVGYSLSQNAYLCLEPNTSRLFHSRHVIFHEGQFPFQKSNPHSPVPISNLPATQDSSVPISLPHVLLAPPGHAASPEVGAVLSPSSANGSSPAPPPLQVSTLSSPSFISSQNSPLEMPAPAVPPNNAARPHRMTTRSMNNIYKPKTSFVVTKYPLPPSLEPTSVTEALTDSRWRDAMSSELTALMRHNTWQLVPPPADCNIVGCKWVFRIKRHADGSIDRFKARLVAKGFNQRPGLDYKETFSPVVKPVTIRTVLTLAVMYGWSLRQLDVNNAFLHGHLTEKVYMKQPPGFTSPEHPNHICCLTKAIYGLKQAPRAWFSALKQALLEFGFINAKSDSSLFVFHDGSILAYCLVYVDDLILTGNNSTFVASIIDQLGQKFSLKDLGPLHFFLGVEVIPTKEGLFLTQHKYIRDMLSKTSMAGAKDVTTPLSTSVSLKLADGSSSVDSTEYRRVIGALQYLSLTRPDISFAVNKLSQFMHSPTQTHWTATKRLLRYLKNTIFHGINIRKTSSPALTCFSDADWAGSLDDRKSTSAYLIFLGHTPISWSSKKQRAIARSSTEAEYRALATAAAESMWLLSLFQELKFTLTQPPTLLCDNLGATHLSFNPVQHSRMKHIQIDIHFVRDLVAKKILNVKHVHTADQLADLLTKPLSRQRTDYLRNKIGLSDGSPFLRGRIKETEEVKHVPTQA